MRGAAANRSAALSETSRTPHPPGVLGYDFDQTPVAYLVYMFMFIGTLCAPLGGGVALAPYGARSHMARVAGLAGRPQWLVDHRESAGGTLRYSAKLRPSRAAPGTSW